MEFQIQSRKIGSGGQRNCAGIQLHQEFSVIPCCQDRAANLPVISEPNQASNEMSVLGL